MCYSYPIKNACPRAVGPTILLTFNLELVRQTCPPVAVTPSLARGYLTRSLKKVSACRRLDSSTVQSTYFHHIKSPEAAILAVRTQNIRKSKLILILDVVLVLLLGCNQPGTGYSTGSHSFHLWLCWLSEIILCRL